MPGVPEEVAAATVVLPPNDLGGLARTLEQDPDIACVVLEPTGAAFGVIPTGGEFLRGVRELTAAHGVVLIFDEVISGFRVAPGGAQEYYGVTPDLTTLAKIVAGGLPGGALAGRAEIMALLEFRDDPDWNHTRKMPHPGTYNANPLSAAAGTAALRLVRDEDHIGPANRAAQRLRARMNEVIGAHGVGWCAYGEFSRVVLLTDHDCPTPGRCDFSVCGRNWRRLRAWDARQQHLLRCAFILNGVDFPGFAGMTSSAHTEGDVEKTAQAFDSVIGMFEREGLVS